MTKLLLENWKRYIFEELQVSKNTSIFDGTDFDLKSEDGKAKIFVGSGMGLSNLISAAYPKYIDSAKYIRKHKDKVAWIDYIESEQTNKGSGSRLIENIFSLLKEDGVKFIFLHTASGSEQDKRKNFFIKHGFVELEKVDENRPRRLMMKKLA
jgi:hypothetical protein